MAFGEIPSYLIVRVWEGQICHVFFAREGAWMEGIRVFGAIWGLDDADLLGNLGEIFLGFAWEREAR